MIVGFADKDTEEFWQTGRSSRIPSDIRKRAFAKLQLLHAATSLDFLKVPPGNQLEKLKGDRKNQYSIRVNRQWRICFVWADGDVRDVEFVDYH